jgi:hypothetical protein
MMPAVILRLRIRAEYFLDQARCRVTIAATGKALRRIAAASKNGAPGKWILTPGLIAAAKTNVNSPGPISAVSPRMH